MSTKVCYLSVFKLTTLLSIFVEIEFQRQIIIRALKYFVTPTITYTAQDDESWLHINFNTHHIIEYVLNMLCKYC